MAEIFYSSWKSQASEAGYTYQWRLGFQYTVTQQVSANTSKLKREIYLYYQSSNTTYSTSFPSQFTVVGGGTNRFYTAITFRGNSSAKIYEDEKTLKHNADGTYGNLTLSISYAGNSYQSYNSASKTIAIPVIDRYPVLTSAPNFNDEANPTIKYTTSLGMTGATVQACIAVDGSTKVPYRDVIVEDGQYTFELTESERNTLRNLIPNSKTLTVEFTLRTTESGGTNHFSVLERTMTIVNGNPTFNVAYQDTNSTTLAITNNDQQIIQNKSTLQFNITNAEALKGASLSNVSIDINGVVQTQSISSATLNFNYGTINVAENLNASVVLTDTRGLTATIEVPLTILGWQTPTALITLNRKSNFYTETDITVDANYSSLDSKNVITIQYRIKKKSTTTWGSWNNLTDNVTTTFNADNEYEWDVQVKVEDLLGSKTYNQSIGIGIPIFFIDRAKRSAGVNCFPRYQNTFELNGIVLSNTYSENEIPIGMWINNKIIYQKVIPYTNSSAIGSVGQNTIINIPHGVSNIDLAWIVSAFTSDSRPIPFFNGTSSLSNGICIPVIDKTNIKLRIVNNSWGSRTWYFILNYTKVSLPSDYTQLDYIESDGTKYIQTNYTLTNSNSAEIKVSLGATTTNQMLFGSRTGASSQNISINASTTNFSVDFNNSSYSTYRCSYAYTLNVPYIISVSKNERAVYDEDGNVLASNTTVCNDTITTPQNATLFYINPKPGSSWYIPTGAKIYYCKIWNGDTLVRDLIPCYRNNDSVVGMYDLVNNVFYQETAE